MLGTKILATKGAGNEAAIPATSPATQSISSAGLAVVLCLGLAGSAQAASDSDEVSELKAMMQAMEARHQAEMATIKARLQAIDAEQAQEAEEAEDIARLRQEVQSLSALATTAQDENSTRINGYGGWAVGNSDQYSYLTGIGDGDNQFKNVDFTLVVSAQPAERLTLYAQVGLRSDHETEETEVDIAAADWTLNEHASLRFGRSAFPFGLYTEIFDVGTLRPFFNLPQSIYGPTGFVAEGYDGAGLRGYFSTDGGWGISWDVYGGGLDADLAEPFEQVLEGGEGEPGGRKSGEGEGAEGEEEGEGEQEIKNVLGGRVVFETPVDGLSFGISAFGGEPTFDKLGLGTSWGDVHSYAAQFEYLTDKMSVRSELGAHQGFDFETEVAYVELGYYLTDEWQLALRGDTVQVNSDEEEKLPAAARSLLEHDELSVGVNYWFNDNLVVKLSYHDIDGNLFAVPEGRELLEIIEAGKLDDSNQLINLGVQFSF